MNTHHYLLRAIFIVPICLCLHAPESQGHDSIPVSLMGVDQGIYTVCIDKSRQKLHVYNGRDEVLVLPCSTGMNPGDKKVAGDKRTPEGIYFFKKIIPGGDLPYFYGWRAYTLNYPNPVDRSEGKNGNGIWIHGRIIPLDETDTKGCVSLVNEDLKTLSAYLKAYRTPIITLENMTYLDEKGLDALEQSYKEFISSWLDAWENKDIERYSSCYSPKFYDSQCGDDLETYIQRKKNIFEQYDYISIRTNGIRIVGSEGYVMCFFLMDFAGGSYQSTGVKFVYIENTSSAPKILAEDFIPLDDLPQWQADARDLKNSEQRSLMAFIDTWSASWESKDMTRMKDCYADSFPLKETYLERKQKNIASYKSIEVSLKDVETRRTGVHLLLRARQEFNSDCYHDVGIKELQLIRTRKGFLITQEKWEPLYEGS